MTTQEIAKRSASLAKLDYSKVPAALGAIINMPEWAASIVVGAAYHEPNPDFVSQMLAYQVITADTIEEAFANQGVRQLQKMLPDTPEANTGNIEITDLYVAESDFETGQPTYVIVSVLSLEDGTTYKFTTGATNIQATIFALLRMGTWPIRCKIKRGETKDKGGRFLLFMLPAD